MTEKEHIPSLDGLRGLAILFVLFYHLLNHGFLYPLFAWGWMGVDLFFVLSGFLITGILLDSKHKQGFIQSFLLRRALRILPLYYAVLIVFALIAPHFNPTAWFSRYQFFFWTHTSNLVILNHGLFRPLGHFWSLAIEEQFYIIWPFVVLFFSQKKLIWVALTLIILGIYLRFETNNPYLTYGLPLAHLDGLLMGAIIAVLIRLNQSSLFRYSNKIFAFACSCFLFNLFLGLDHNAPLTFTIISFFFGAALITSLRSPMVKNILSYKVLLFFGKYSYGMYIFNSIFFHFSNWAGADRLASNQRLFVYVGVFGLTIVVSYMSYNLFEIRFLRLKERVNQFYMTGIVKKNPGT